MPLIDRDLSFLLQAVELSLLLLGVAERLGLELFVLSDQALVRQLEALHFLVELGYHLCVVVILQFLLPDDSIELVELLPMSIVRLKLALR